MRKLYLAQICAGALLLLASSASAALHCDGGTGATKRSHQIADSQLAKPAPTDGKLFSNVMLDPARCNYEYVDMHGTMVVRTELKLTCTTTY